MPKATACACGAARRCAAFAWAVAGRRGWSWRARIALLRVASRWQRAGFRAMPGETVADLAADLPTAVRRDFIEPLCVAALNTPADEASGAVFLRVLRDALVGSPGVRRPAAAAGRPRQRLSRARPGLARAQRRDDPTRPSHRADRARWGRLAHRRRHRRPDRPRRQRGRGGAARQLARRRVGDAGRRLALRADRHRLRAQRRLHPAGADARAPRRRRRTASAIRLRSRPARRRDRDARLRDQRRGALGRARHRGHGGGDVGAGKRPSWRRFLRAPLEIVRTIVEKRATFACTPGLVRPSMEVAPGLFACGDYLAGPYPATLEGAVRSGVAAARAATGRSGENSGMKVPA